MSRQQVNICLNGTSAKPMLMLIRTFPFRTKEAKCFRLETKSHLLLSIERFSSRVNRAGRGPDLEVIRWIEKVELKILVQGAAEDVHDDDDVTLDWIRLFLLTMDDVPMTYQHLQFR